jgi:hypothetical protein
MTGNMYVGHTIFAIAQRGSHAEFKPRGGPPGSIPTSMHFRENCRHQFACVLSSCYGACGGQEVAGITVSSRSGYLSDRASSRTESVREGHVAHVEGSSFEYRCEVHRIPWSLTSTIVLEISECIEVKAESRPAETSSFCAGRKQVDSRKVP